MASIPVPELISAYLDGEADAAERAAVEQALVEDAGLRRMFYEFRSLHAQLAKLPRYRLKQDLSREVIRQVDLILRQRRSKLASTASPATGGGWTKIRWTKVAVWAGAAAAALLMSAFWAKPIQRELMIARHDPADAELKQKDEHATGNPAKIDKVGGAKPARTRAAPDSPIVSEEKEMGKARPTPELDTLTQRRAEGATAAGPAGRITATPMSTPAPVAPDKEVGFDRQDKAQRAQSTIADNLTADHVLTVRCDVAAGGDFRAIFQKSLENNQIAWRDSGAARRGTLAGQAHGEDDKTETRSAASKKLASQDAETNSANALSQSGGLAPAGARTAAEKPINSESAISASDEDVELIYVEAAPEQVAALVHELESRKDVFLSAKLWSESAEKVGAPDVEGTPANERHAFKDQIANSLERDGKRAQNGKMNQGGFGGGGASLPESRKPDSSKLKEQFDKSTDAPASPNIAGEDRSFARKLLLRRVESPLAAEPDAQKHWDQAKPAESVLRPKGDQPGTPGAPAPIGNSNQPLSVDGAQKAIETPQESQPSKQSILEDKRPGDGPMEASPTRVLFVFRVVKGVNNPAAQAPATKK